MRAARLKEILGVVAVVGFAVLAGIGGGTILVEWTRGEGAGAAAVGGPAREQLAAGARVAAAGRMYHGKAAFTAVAFVSSGCRLCAESVDFYKRLQARLQARNGRFVVASIEPQDATRSFLAMAGFEADGMVDYHELGIPLRGTPTLLLVDGSGLVRRSWTGRLSPAQEADAIAAILAEK